MHAHCRITAKHPWAPALHCEEELCEDNCGPVGLQRLDLFCSEMELSHLVANEAVLCFHSTKSYHHTSNPPNCVSLKCFSCGTMELSYFQASLMEPPWSWSMAENSFTHFCSFYQILNKGRFCDPAVFLHYHVVLIFSANICVMIYFKSIFTCRDVDLDLYIVFIYFLLNFQTFCHKVGHNIPLICPSLLCLCISVSLFILNISFVFFLSWSTSQSFYF